MSREVDRASPSYATTQPALANAWNVFFHYTYTGGWGCQRVPAPIAKGHKIVAHIMHAAAPNNVEAAGNGGVHLLFDPDQLPNFSAMNVIFSLNVPPIELTIASTAAEMPTATNPYSTAVPPDSSLKNSNTFCIVLAPSGFKQRHSRVAALN